MIFQDHIDIIKKQPSLGDYHAQYLANCKALHTLIDNLHIGKREYKKVTDACRNMALCFKDGQRIRHKKSLSTEWVGVFNKSTGTISCKGNNYTSLGQFALAHHKTENPSRTTVYGWGECECEINGEWVSTCKLPELSNN